MKKHLPRIICIFSLSTLIVGVFGHVAQAQSIISSVLGYGNFAALFAEVVATFMNWLITGMSVLLALAGYLLNFSINLTLNIKSFVDSSPAIYNTWRAIRDISDMFIIFVLLYAAIRLILGFDAKFGSLIKNIVVAGVLINFSFFFAGLGIDASNIISVQLYNAIAPANSLNAGTVSSNMFQGSFTTGLDGGLSDVFMSSLKIPALYNESLTDQSAASKTVSGNTIGAGTVSAPLKIFLMGVVALVIELTATLSFAVAALAFVIRFVILLLLLAFSPIWFASHVVPMTAEYAKKWVSAYKGMLIFMPAYLLLMYLALNVLTTSPLFGTLNSAGALGNGKWYSDFLVLGVNAAIVIILLNAPLVAAASIAGTSIPLLDKAAKSIGARAIWGRVGGFAGTHTAGAWAGRLDKGLAGTWAGNTLLGRDIRDVTTGPLAKSRMGGVRSYEERVTARKEVTKKAKEIEHGERLDSLLDEVKAGKPMKIDPVTGKPMIMSIIGQMNEKEKLAFIGKNVKDEAALKEIIKHVKSSDFEAVKKSDDLLDEEKIKIANMRKDALNDALSKHQAEAIKNMLDNMDGKELLKLGGGTLILDEVIGNLKPSQLKNMADEGLDDTTKRVIGGAIDTWLTAHGTPHRARGYVNKNRAEWT
ncbi:MAG: hypothetical protein ABSF56_01200 [Minisyncoccia bacterium]